MVGSIFFCQNLGKGEIIHTNGGYDYFKHVTISDGAKKEYWDNIHGDFNADDYSYMEAVDDTFDF